MDKGTENRELTFLEAAEIWDKGGFVLNLLERKLQALKTGEELKDVLSGCTVCPVGNATCLNYLDLLFVGFHPSKGCEKHSIMICGLGVKDIDHCPLSK